MPDFNLHLTSGIITGAAVAAAGVVAGDLSPVQAGAAAVLGTTGGLLPDLDSDSGKPLALLFQLLSVLLPILAFSHLPEAWRSDIAFQLCYFPSAYLAVHYLACPLIKRMTRHRGMMHSLPFALVAAECAYLLLASSGVLMAFYGTLAVFSGCLVHLVLDELHAMELKFGMILVVKRSSGSALKLASNDLAGTMFMYLLLLFGTAALAIRLFPELGRSLPAGFPVPLL
ncbi:hypothetical protein JCM14469_34930 [Desulfatiferula olefinivorans]